MTDTLRLAAAAAATGAALLLAVPAAVTATAAPGPLDQAASRFAALTDLSGQIAERGTRSAVAIADAVDTAAAITHQGLVQSASSYGALAAAQDPDFRASVEAAAALRGRDTLIAELSRDPALIQSLSGAEAGANAAGDALNRALQRVDHAVDVTHNASYSLQRTAWARTRSDATARVLAVTRASSSNWQPLGFTRAAIALPQGDSAGGGLAVSDTVLAAGALAVLGADRAATDLADRTAGDHCLRRAHLTLRMCIAAAGFPYEQSFCLSRHALGDAASCIRAGVR